MYLHARRLGLFEGIAGFGIRCWAASSGTNLIPCNNWIVGLACCCPAYLKPCNLSSKTSVLCSFNPTPHPYIP